MNPKKPAGDKSRGIGVAIPPPLHLEGKALAAKLGLKSFSALMQTLLVKAIKEAGEAQENAGQKKVERANRKEKAALQKEKAALEKVNHAINKQKKSHSPQ